MTSTAPQAPSSPPPSDSGWVRPAVTGPAHTAWLGELNELLEAERAGARVAMETARVIADPVLAALVDDIHKDEVHWCGMLMRTIKSLGGAPSTATGAFFSKAMAIPNLDDRLRFLNRGQAWVVRKLEAMTPRISDASVRTELNHMQNSHQQSIKRLEARASPGTPGDSIQTLEPQAPSEPEALIEHIVARFHEVHRRQLPELIRLAAKVESVHAEHAASPRGLAALLHTLQAELLEHMEKEERILFPMLAAGGNAFVVHPIRAMRAEHDEHAERIARLLALTHDAIPPEDACDTWRLLSAGVQQFVQDLQHHIRLENNVLFPQFESPRG